MSERLSAAGAFWDSGPAAGEWIGPLLAEFGPTLGHAVPSGYDAYAVIPIPWGDVPERQDYPVLQALIDQLAPSTGDQAVHSGLWEGWGWLYDRDDDRRADYRVARPDASPLKLPHRNYYLCTGQLSAVTALREYGDPPSLIWPEDRSWFIGAPIYTMELALGADERVIHSMLQAPSLGARRSQRDEVLQSDD